MLLLPLRLAMAILVTQQLVANDGGDKQHQVLKSLYTFDDAKLPSGFKINNGEAIFESDATGSSKALRIRLQSQDNKFAGLTIAPAKPWDWSEFSDFSLAFDLENKGEVSTQIYLNMSDGKGGGYSRCVSVPVGRRQDVLCESRRA